MSCVHVLKKMTGGQSMFITEFFIDPGSLPMIGDKSIGDLKETRKRN